jgi:NADH dehydrogenase (ubiquinone) 1 beta subcomplex subunit 3
MAGQQTHQPKILHRDPWAKREAWRKQPFFSKANTIKGMFPGLGIATVAFAIYCGVEYAITPKDDAHH